MEVRAQVRQRLLTQVPDFGDRVFLPGSPRLTAAVAKPFAIVRFTTLATDGEWDARSGRAQVWVNAPPGDYLELDRLVDQTVAALDHRLLTDADGRRYVVVYAGSPLQEAEDLTYQSLARPLDFMVYRLDWLAPAGVSPDPTLQGLTPWSAAVWPQVGTDPATWNPADATPGVYWRLERGRTVASADDEVPGWMELTLRGHVLAPTAAARDGLARRIASALGQVRVLTVAAGTPAETDLWVDEATFDTRVNPFTDGQLIVRARLAGFLTDDPIVVTPGPLIETIHIGVDPSQDGVVDLTATVPVP
jgi:hypothetical protein